MQQQPIHLITITFIPFPHCVTFTLINKRWEFQNIEQYIFVRFSLLLLFQIFLFIRFISVDVNRAFPSMGIFKSTELYYALATSKVNEWRNKK